MKTGQEIRILLIEDNPGDVRLFREALKECAGRFTIRVAGDGEEARNALFGPNALPDLIVLDLNLPKLTGDQLLLLIKADTRLRRIPVVILSGSNDVGDILRSYENQASCYLVKPADLSDYMKLVQAWGNFWMSSATLPPRQSSLAGASGTFAKLPA